MTIVNNQLALRHLIDSFKKHSLSITVQYDTRDRQTSLIYEQVCFLCADRRQVW